MFWFQLELKRINFFILNSLFFYQFHFEIALIDFAAFVSGWHLYKRMR